MLCSVTVCAFHRIAKPSLSDSVAFVSILSRGEKPVVPEDPQKDPNAALKIINCS